MSDTRELNWLQRNWMWVLPLGILTGVVVGGAAFLVPIIRGMEMMTSREAYSMALDTARGSIVARDLLGQPIEENGPTSYVVSTKDGDTVAELTITLAGPVGSGRLSGRAAFTDDVWTLTELYLTTTDFPQGLSLLDEDLFIQESRPTKTPVGAEVL